MVAAPEAAARAVLPTATESTPVVGGTEGVMVEGPSDTTAVAEETGRELSLALTSESRHPPAWDEPPLWWVSPWDPSSKLFTLDDAAEGMGTTTGSARSADEAMTPAPLSLEIGVTSGSDPRLA